MEHRELWMRKGRETRADPEGWGGGAELLAMVVAVMPVDMKVASGCRSEAGE